ncbi:putative membrane protein [Bradyrhizobium sp. LM3.4]
MAQQIEQLKVNIAELKAGQEQMAREMAKPPAPKPMADARPPVDPRARVSARPPAPPVRKPKPAVSQTYMPAYSPAPLAPPPSQAAAVPPPAAPITTQAVADDDGPVVRPPMPLR